MSDLYKHGTIRYDGQKRMEFEKILIEINARRQVLGKKALTRSELIHFSTQSLNINKAVNKLK